MLPAVSVIMLYTSRIALTFVYILCIARQTPGRNARQTRVLYTAASRCCDPGAQYASIETKRVRIGWNENGLNAFSLSCAYVLHGFKKSFNCTTSSIPLNTQTVQHFAFPCFSSRSIFVLALLFAVSVFIDRSLAWVLFVSLVRAIAILAYVHTRTHTNINSNSFFSHSIDFNAVVNAKTQRFVLSHTFSHKYTHARAALYGHSTHRRKVLLP